METNNLPSVYVRPPSSSYERAVRSRPLPIDIPLACAQHTQYIQALQDCHQVVEILPPLASYPDSCFVQDPAIIYGSRALVCRFGVESRRGEASEAAQILEKRFTLDGVEAPGTLEGGDVLVLPGKLVVGQSGRTNSAGIACLRQFAAELDLPLEVIEVHNYLHLLTAVTYIGQNTLLALEPYASHPVFAGFQVVTISPDEAYSANGLGFSGSVIIPAGFPKTESALRQRGFEVYPVPLSQFEAADGGVSCLSMVCGPVD